MPKQAQPDANEDGNPSWRKKFRDALSTELAKWTATILIALVAAGAGWIFATRSDHLGRPTEGVLMECRQCVKRSQPFLALEKIEKHIRDLGVRKPAERFLEAVLADETLTDLRDEVLKIKSRLDELLRKQF